jgi:uncharacterized protein DUF3987
VSPDWQANLAAELRRRAVLVDGDQASQIESLATHIDTETHPGELARWLVETAEAGHNGDLSSDEPGFPPAPRPLRADAFHGPAGEFVRTIDPHTEADPAATLIQFLLAFGNACGRGPGFRVESDEHGTNEFVAIVGPTSKARKGSSWGHVRRFMRLVDLEWETRCIGSGIASGEGLIHAVRDPLVIQRKARNKEERSRADADGRIEEEVDPGVGEKRLLVIQGELAQVLRVMQREGNTVSPILRDLWDHGNARGMSKHQPERTTGSLVTLIGHITVRELRRELTEVEAGNGFGNRWLWVFAKRSKRLPRGGHLDDDDLYKLAGKVSRSLRTAGGRGMLDMTEDAWQAWELLYEELSEGADDLAGAVTARAEAHVRRLAVLYALLDEAEAVEVEHLRAAMAVWDYCAASAAHIFGGKVGDPFADKILEAIRETGGLTRTEIRSVAGGHVPAQEIDQVLRGLDARGLAHEQVLETAGRPAHRWVPGCRSKVRELSEQRGSGGTFPPNPQALSSEDQASHAGDARDEREDLFSVEELLGDEGEGGRW